MSGPDDIRERKPAGALVEAQGLAVGYGATPAVVDISFAAAAGQRVALLGPNGGGKTTLLRAVSGELAPLAGALTVRGATSTVPQTDRTRLDYPVSALDVATMGSLARLAWWRRPGRRERQAARAALARVGAAGLADRTYGELSGGQRQRVLIARGLVREAPIVLLDEPFAGLDATSAAGLERLIASLAAEGRAVLIATHDLVQARGWDRVLCLNGAQIAFGEPDEVLSRGVLEQTYGDELIEIPGGGRAGIMSHHSHD